MKTVGDKLEAFTVTAAKLGSNHIAEDGQFAFEEITHRSFSGKWKKNLFLSEGLYVHLPYGDRRVREAGEGL